MVAFVVVRMMNTQAIAKLILWRAAQLALEFIALAYLGLQIPGESRSILLPSDAALPHRVEFSAHSFGDLEQPFLVRGHCQSALPCLFSQLMVFPVEFHLGAVVRPFASTQPRSRLSLSSGTHSRSRLWGSNVCRLAPTTGGRLGGHQTATFRTWDFLAWHGGIVA